MGSRRCVTLLALRLTYLSLTFVTLTRSFLTQIHVTVPDLITVLDSQNGAALGTPDYRYGLRVTVIAMAGHPSWITPKGLANGGPTAFG